MTPRVRFEHVVSFVTGAAVALLVNRVTGWWLDSGVGVVSMLAADLVMAFVVARWRSAERKGRAMALWLGGLVGMTIFLVWTGPGTIWPLVLIVGALVTAAPILVGVALATVMEWTS